MDIEEIRSLALKHILWSFSAINLMYGSDFAGVNFFFWKLPEAIHRAPTTKEFYE